MLTVIFGVVRLWLALLYNFLVFGIKFVIWKYTIFN